MAKRKLRAARAAYPSDLTDAQWALIAPLIPPAEPGGRERGYDGVKKVNGRKRHLLVDTLGLILAVLVHGADVSEREGARWLLKGVLAARQTGRGWVCPLAAFVGGCGLQCEGMVSVGGGEP